MQHLPGEFQCLVNPLLVGSPDEVEPHSRVERVLSESIDEVVVQWNSEAFRNGDSAPLLLGILGRQCALCSLDPVCAGQDPVADFRDTGSALGIPSRCSQSTLVEV